MDAPVVRDRSSAQRRWMAWWLAGLLGLSLLLGGAALLLVRYQPALLLASGLSSIKDQPLRQAYEREVRQLKAEAEQMTAAGASPEQVARALHQRRREIGIRYKEMTPAPLRERIYELNRQRYGDPLGPSYEYLVGKNTHDGVVDYRAIIEGASRPNANVDRLLSTGGQGR